jgi:hypothetical protein
VNASASLLDREVEVQTKVRRVSTFGRYGRVVCSALFGFGLIGSVAMLVTGALGVNSPTPMSDITLTTQQKMWVLPLEALAMGLSLGVVFQFYRLFGNLATGAIYTSENVRRVRNVGVLWLSWALLGVVLPGVWTALVTMGLIEPSDPPKLTGLLPVWEALNAVVSAGLILLVSWVMEIGLYEKDHAAELKRDADLVI